MIFVDSSFWIAVSLHRDDRHAPARELATMHSAKRLVTTNHVVGETWTFLRRRDSHRMAVLFLDRIGRSPRVEAVHVSPEQEREAFRWLRRHDERRYSFVDATSFVVMQQLGLTEALAFDGDFSAAGFVELRV